MQIAERVISWLESEESWLLVVDNVDNLTVLSQRQDPNFRFLLLPSTGKSHQNTLITTRNCYANGIPAQAKEVKKLDQDGSLALLYGSSEITPSDSAEEHAAATIVEKLDHLPLAINLAGAYIREERKKSMNFRTFLTEYSEYRRELTDWMPEEIQQYTVATCHLLPSLPTTILQLFNCYVSSRL